jgi:hypothetical protein
MTRPALGPCHSPSDQVPLDTAGDWVLLPADSLGGKGTRISVEHVSTTDGGGGGGAGGRHGRPASTGPGIAPPGSSFLAGVAGISTGPASSSMPALNRAAGSGSNSPAKSGALGAASSFKQGQVGGAGGSEGSLLLAERVSSSRVLASPASTGHLGDAALPGAEGAHKRSRHGTGAGAGAGMHSSGVHHVPHVRNDDVHASLIDTD